MILLDGFEGYANVADSASGGLTRGGQWFGDTVASSGDYFVDHGGRGLAKQFGGVNTGSTRYLYSRVYSTAAATTGVAINSEIILEQQLNVALGLQVDRTDEPSSDTVFARIESNGSQWQVRVLNSWPGATYNTGIAIVPNQWYYLELQVELTSPTTSNVKARINGVTAINVATSFGGTAIRRNVFVLCHPTASSKVLIDDFYLAGDLVWHGPMAIVPMALSQGNLNEWTAHGDSTVLACVDDVPCDLDATYARAGKVGKQQSFNAAFTIEPDFILMTSMARSEALSPLRLRHFDGVQGNYRMTDGQSVPEEYVNLPAILETLYDGSPLTLAGVNSQEYGFEVVEEDA